MFAAMAALNKRKTTLNPTTIGICLMMGLPVTNSRCLRTMYAERLLESRKSAERGSAPSYLPNRLAMDGKQINEPDKRK